MISKITSCGLACLLLSSAMVVPLAAEMKQSKLEKRCPTCKKKRFFTKADDEQCTDCLRKKTIQQRREAIGRLKRQKKDEEAQKQREAAAKAAKAREEAKQKEEEAARQREANKDAVELAVEELEKEKEVAAAQEKEEKEKTQKKETPQQKHRRELAERRQKMAAQRRSQQQRRTPRIWKQGASDDEAFNRALAQSLKETKGPLEDATVSDAITQALDLAKAGTYDEKDFDVPTLGLFNIGATCFANSTLQCLLQLPPLQEVIFNLGKPGSWEKDATKRIKSAIEKEFVEREKKCTTEDAKKALAKRKNNELSRADLSVDHVAQYQLLARGMQIFAGRQLGNIFSPRLFCTTMRKRVFEGNTGQQDAREFFTAFAADVRDVAEKDPFAVQENSQIVCSECKTSSPITTVESSLALPIKGGSLKECLAAYGEKETLTGNNQYNCKVCKGKRDATKFLTINSMPPVLVIQLVRFGFSDEKVSKNVDPVSFTLELEAQDFYQGDEKTKGVVYDLVGIVEHGGAVGGGHYIAYAKNSNNKKWYYCDDERVFERTVQQIEVIATAGIDGKITPYLLFYLRRS